VTPGVRFHVLNREASSFDGRTFAKLYLPILGKTAAGLYQLLRVTTSGRLSNLIDALNVGQPALLRALDKLSALGLVQVFEDGPSVSFALKSHKSYEAFLSDVLLRNLLATKIGETALKNLLPEKPKGHDVSKRFSDVFLVDTPESEEVAVEADATSEIFDLASFKERMTKLNLRFSRESVDVTHLYSMAEKFGLDWFELVQLAQETANVDQTINTKAMIARFVNRQNTQNDRPSVPSAYKELVSLSKKVAPIAFLSQLKKEIGGIQNDASERYLLSNLTDNHMTAEVQNILIHYILVQQGRGSLSAKYVNSIAGQWLRSGVTTAEEAVQAIEDFNARIRRTKTEQKVVKKAPDWENERTTSDWSPEEQARFIAERQKARKDK
jgi:replication initiation and membrane attachment protein